MRAGFLGQIKGPFQGGKNALQEFYDKNNTSSEKMKLGISIDEKDFLPYGNEELYPNGLAFTIVGPISSVLVQMGRTCMYETDQPIQVNQIVFSDDVPASVIINFVIY